MKVAFATQDLQRVDAHFGWARYISIFEIDGSSYRFVENYAFGGNLEEDGNEDKLGPKLDAIQDCAILYVTAIGGSAAARVVAAKVHPVKVAEPTPIFDILDRLLVVLHGNPPPWLRKALQKGRPRALDFDGDDEAGEPGVARAEAGHG